MEESLKFNSQVCTTKEQSQRLLELGLKPETADMAHIAFGGGGMMIRPYNWVSTTEVDIENFYPAWSLHRLIEMCGIDRMPISFHKKGKIRIRVNHIHPTHEGRSGYNHYNSLIDCIEWLISENYFNKEYLKQ